MQWSRLSMLRVTFVALTMATCGCSSYDPIVVRHCVGRGNSEAVCRCVATKVKQNLSEKEYGKYLLILEDGEKYNKQVEKDAAAGTATTGKAMDLFKNSLFGQFVIRAGLGLEPVVPIYEAALTHCRS